MVSELVNKEKLTRAKFYNNIRYYCSLTLIIATEGKEGN